MRLLFRLTQKARRCGHNMYSSSMRIYAIFAKLKLLLTHKIKSMRNLFLIAFWVEKPVKTFHLCPKIAIFSCFQSHSQNWIRKIKIHKKLLKPLTCKIKSKIFREFFGSRNLILLNLIWFLSRLIQANLFTTYIGLKWS